VKQGRQNRKSLSLGPLKRDAPETFFRLCHHCLFLNESEVEIYRCNKCEKDFNPPEKDGWEETQGDLRQQLEAQMDQEMEGDQEEPAQTNDKSSHIPRKKSYLNGLNGKW